MPVFGYLYIMKKRVTGLGGVFFKSANPTALIEWYGKHLHIESGEHRALFKWRQDEDPEKAGYTAWSVFPDDTAYFKPADRDFIFNYQVENLKELLQVLKEEAL